MKSSKVNIVLCVFLLLVITGCTQAVSQKKLVENTEQEETIIPTEQPEQIDTDEEVIEDIEGLDANNIDIDEFDDWTQDFDGL